jgi:hypothetical protein
MAIIGRSNFPKSTLPSVKSVQHGNVTFGLTDTVKDTTITAVDTANSVIICNGVVTMETGASWPPDALASFLDFNGSNKVRAERYLANNREVIVPFQVIEFAKVKNIVDIALSEAHSLTSLSAIRFPSTTAAPYRNGSTAPASFDPNKSIVFPRGTYSTFGSGGNNGYEIMQSCQLYEPNSNLYSLNRDNDKHVISYYTVVEFY